MSTSRIVLIAVLLLVVSGLFVSCSAISWDNTAVALEEATTAQYMDNQNQYDAFWKKVKEAAQIPDKYKNDFKDLLVSETQAKFGPEGSKAAFQWLKDRDINFDGSLYKKIQDLIESGRDDFKRGQTELLSKQQAVRVHYNSFWGRKVKGWFDRPTALKGKQAPSEDYDGDGRLTVLDYKIVTSTKTAKAFQTGEDEALDVFGKK